MKEGDIYEGRPSSPAPRKCDEGLRDLISGGTYNRMNKLLCALGFHSHDAVYVEWNLGVSAGAGSKAAIIGKCRCGKERLVLPRQVPVYLHERTTQGLCD